MKVDSKVGMAREGDEMWRRPLGQGRCGLGDLGLGGAVEGRDDWVSPGRSLFEAGSRCDCLLQRVCLPTAVQPRARAMGRLSLLFLAFLTPGAAIPVPPALRAFSKLHLSTSFTSHSAIAMKFTTHYIEQKVRPGVLRGALGFHGPPPPNQRDPRHRSPPGISLPCCIRLVRSLDYPFQGMAPSLSSV